MALITGGSSGIGLATAHEFVKEGAFVFVTGRREAELAAAVAEIGRSATAIQADVSNSVVMEEFSLGPVNKGKTPVRIGIFKWRVRSYMILTRLRSKSGCVITY